VIGPPLSNGRHECRTREGAQTERRAKMKGGSAGHVAVLRCDAEPVGALPDAVCASESRCRASWRWLHAAVSETGAPANQRPRCSRTVKGCAIVAIVRGSPGDPTLSTAQRGLASMARLPCTLTLASRSRVRRRLHLIPRARASLLVHSIHSVPAMLHILVPLLPLGCSPCVCFSISLQHPKPSRRPWKRQK
jgi:hypothetical protein